jgi:hypothetical protein
MTSKLEITHDHYEPEGTYGSSGATAVLNGSIIIDTKAKDLFEKEEEDTELEDILHLALEHLGVQITHEGSYYEPKPLKGEVRHNLDITWSDDTYDCETCGTSWATGATALLDGKKIVDKEASAHCYSGSGEVYLEGILLIALEKLGVEVVDSDEDLQWFKDTCYEWDLGPKEEIIYKKL